MQDIRKPSSWWTLTTRPHDLSVFSFRSNQIASALVVKKYIALAGSSAIKCVVTIVSSSQSVPSSIWLHSVIFFFFLLLSLLTGLVKNFCKFKFLLEALSSGLFGLHEPRWGEFDFASELWLWLFGSCCHGVSLQGEVWRAHFCLMIVWDITLTHWLIPF